MTLPQYLHFFTPLQLQIIPWKSHFCPFSPSLLWNYVIYGPSEVYHLWMAPLLKMENCWFVCRKILLFCPTKHAHSGQIHDQKDCQKITLWLIGLFKIIKRYFSVFSHFEWDLWKETYKTLLLKIQIWWTL